MNWEALLVPSIVLCIGLTSGGVLVFLNIGKTKSTALKQGEENDLKSAHDAVLNALNALEMEKDKLSTLDYEAERKLLLAHGAEALRRLDRGFTPKPSGPGHLIPILCGSLMGLVVFLFGYYVFDALLAKISVGTGMATYGGVLGLRTLGKSKTAAPELKQSQTESVAKEEIKDSDKPLTAEEVLLQNREAMGEEAYQAALAGLKAGPPQSPWISPRWQGAFWVLGILSVFAGIYGILYLSGDIFPKEERATAQTAQQNRVGPDEKEWEDRLANNPKDIEALNKLCWFEIQRRNDVKKATEYHERAKMIDATNQDTRFYGALILFLNRKPALANANLDKLIQDHPDHSNALEFRGLFYVQSGQLEKGRALVVRAEKATKDGAGRIRLRGVLKQIDMQIQASKEAQKVVASGTISGDLAQIGKLDPRAVIFLSLRDPRGGPPIAAKKLPVGPFPLEFVITGADRISMGAPQPIPERFNLSVRVDGDGNAMSREPELPEAALEAIEKGTEGIELMLKKSSPQ